MNEVYCWIKILGFWLQNAGSLVPFRSVYAAEPLWPSVNLTVVFTQCPRPCRKAGASHQMVSLNSLTRSFGKMPHHQNHQPSTPILRGWWCERSSPSGRSCTAGILMPPHTAFEVYARGMRLSSIPFWFGWLPRTSWQEYSSYGQRASCTATLHRTLWAAPREVPRQIPSAAVGITDYKVHFSRPKTRQSSSAGC